MSVTTCPHCGDKCQVPDLAGTVRCPSCQKAFSSPAVPVTVVPSPGAIVVECPYCHARAPALIRPHTSVAGWIAFCYLGLVALLCSGFLPPPQGPLYGILLFGLSWIPLFTLQDGHRHCSRCKIRLG